jgi:hypothetical protein
MKERFIFEGEPLEVDSESQDINRSGRWVRQGRNVVVLLDAGAPPGDRELYEVPPGDLQFPRDVIDSRIDVDAQRALISMASSRDLATINDAFDVLELVKTGRLGGIYKENQRVPALLAQKRGIGWWQLFDQFGDFPWRFLCDSENRQAPPIVVFRRNLDRQRLILALRDVASFKLSLQDPAFCA